MALLFLFVMVFFAFFFVMVFFAFFLVRGMAVGALGERRNVTGSLQAAAELKLDPLEIELFEREQGERLLIDGRRERFLARRRVVALPCPKTPKRPVNGPRLFCSKTASIDDLIIVEGRCRCGVGRLRIRSPRADTSCRPASSRSCRLPVRDFAAPS